MSHDGKEQSFERRTTSMMSSPEQTTSPFECTIHDSRGCSVQSGADERCNVYETASAVTSSGLRVSDCCGAGVGLAELGQHFKFEEPPGSIHAD